MGNNLLSTKTLEDILNRTRGALEEGRTQMYEVAEAAREECRRTEVVYKSVQAEMREAIKEVEKLTDRFARMRMELFESNKNFQDYTEEEKRRIYEDAAQVREALTAAKERERLLRVRRDNLEKTLTKLQEIAARAEALVSQVGMALKYLSSSISDVNKQIENFQAREYASQELIKGQEIERRRIANALHDGPVQDLANAMVQMEICERLYAAGHLSEATANFGQLKAVTQGSIAELRNIIYDLNPMTLDDLGLVLTIRNSLRNLEKQTAIETDFVVLGKEERLNDQIEMAIFRIVQEALNNCRKHANPRLVKVTLEFSSRYISAEVRDDGAGFDMSEIQNKLRSGKHYGMLSMQGRTELLNGTVQIHSEPGKGTRVLVRIPLTEVEGVMRN
ncbi:MAG: ATP-binding protein [Bacillota bacterium]|jgi:two-component system sensor histidine kinase DegS|nr:ATP-binding protein [Bacillota bacterium]NLJ02455.1 histidine kinase [Bacillota bacterium]